MPNVADLFTRIEARARRLSGLTTVRASGHRWSVRSSNALKTVRGLSRANPLMAAFLGELASDDVFLDVGANIGTWTIPAVNGPGRAGQAVAVEPAPGPYLALLENLKLNGAEDRVRALPVVLGDRAGFVEFQVDTLDPSTGTSHVATDNEAAHRPTGALWVPAPIRTSVPVFTVDGLVKEGAIPAPTAIKIDTEGYEGNVLRGLTTSAHSVRIMFVEVHPDRMADGSTPDQIIARIEQLGLRVSCRERRGRQLHLVCERTSPQPGLRGQPD